MELALFALNNFLKRHEHALILLYNYVNAEM